VTTSVHYGAQSYAAAHAAGSDADLIKRFGGVVRRTALHLSGKTGVSPDDLWSVGALAVLEAVRRFDAAQGTKLESYVAYRVRGAMLDELRRLDRLPRRLRGRIASVERARRTLAQELGREPTREEIARAAGVEAHEVDRVTSASVAPTSIDDAPPVESADTDLETLMVGRERAAALRAALSTLNARHQMVLAMRYREELPVKEIAAVLGVSVPRVCQLHNDAVQKLRVALGK
jgi:RNA polymerase sigma factor for flagellar operon FliA